MIPAMQVGISDLDPPAPSSTRRLLARKSAARSRTSYLCKESPKIFPRKFAQRLITDDREIVAIGELTQPCVHRSGDGADSEFFVAQEITDRFPLELSGSAAIAPRHLHIERN